MERLLVGSVPVGSVVMSVLTNGDPLSGGAGWIGAGLLGAVLCWLFFLHLPSKDKQLKELTEAKDKQIESLIEAKDNLSEKLTTAFTTAHGRALDTFKTSMESTQESFTKRNEKTLDTFAVVIKEERATCQKWHEENLDRLSEILADGKELRHHMMNMANAVGLRRVLEEKRAEEKNAREGNQEKD